MSCPLLWTTTVLGLVLTVESTQIPTPSGELKPDVGKEQVQNAKELLRRENLKDKDYNVKETEPNVESPAATASLIQTQSTNPGHQHGNAVEAAKHLRRLAEWAEWGMHEMGMHSQPTVSRTFSEKPDPWVPWPPASATPKPKVDQQVGYWQFEDEHEGKLKNPNYAVNVWLPVEGEDNANKAKNRAGFEGHWEAPHYLASSHGLGTISYAPGHQVKNEHRHPASAQFDQVWPPLGARKYHGRWTWQDQNGYKFPEWKKPEETGANGLGPGRWQLNWEHQRELWMPSTGDEYDKWHNAIERLQRNETDFAKKYDHPSSFSESMLQEGSGSPAAILQEGSRDPICTSCSGGCLTPGSLLESRCDYEGRNGLSLQQYCAMKRGTLCAELNQAATVANGGSLIQQKNDGDSLIRDASGLAESDMAAYHQGARMLQDRYGSVASPASVASELDAGYVSDRANQATEYDENVATEGANYDSSQQDQSAADNQDQAAFEPGYPLDAVDQSALYKQGGSLGGNYNPSPPDAESPQVLESDLVTGYDDRT